MRGGRGLSTWSVSAIALVLAFCGVARAAEPLPRVVIGVPEAIPAVGVYPAMTIDAFRLSQLIFEPLARVDARTGDLEPWLARRWTIEPTGVRVELRRGVTMHSGRELDAATVVAAFNGFRDPKNRAATWLPMFEGVKRARAKSRFEVLFDVDRPTFAQVRNLLTGLRTPPGSGPYVLRKLDGARVDLARSSDWWHGPAPRFDLMYKPVADQTLARQMIARGELDYAAVDGSTGGGRGAVDAVTGGVSGGVNVVSVAGGTGRWIDLNGRRPMFREARVRRALLQAWDRAGAAGTLFGKRPVPARDAFDPAGPAYPAGGAVPFDPRAAAAVFQTLDPPLQFEVLVADAADERWLGLYQNNLRDVGVKMTITRLARDGTWYQRLKDGAYDAAAGGGPLLTSVDSASWATGGAYNTLGFSDARVDADLNALAREFNQSRRAQIQSRGIARIRELCPQLPGWTWAKGARLTSRRLVIDPEYPDDVRRWRLQD